MKEILLDNQIEKQKKIEPDKLNFEELGLHTKEVSELAKNTFKKSNNGFKNINGSTVVIKKSDGIFKIFGISDDLHDFHRYILHGPDKTLNKGHEDKKVMMQALKK